MLLTVSDHKEEIQTTENFTSDKVRSFVNRTIDDGSVATETTTSITAEQTDKYNTSDDKRKPTYSMWSIILYQTYARAVGMPNWQYIGFRIDLSVTRFWIFFGKGLRLRLIHLFHHFCDQFENTVRGIRTVGSCFLEKGHAYGESRRSRAQ